MRLIFHASGTGAALVAILILVLTSVSGAQSVTVRDLADLTLEELMDQTITTATKRPQRVGDTASAVTVLTNDDIRRSGVNTIPDALRLVPGMNVNSVNSAQWAVSARGFNGVFSNNLQVMLDGRTVYTPLFAGVYWDALPTNLEDIDRIEVIRGPGATIWGANAVNGVVNIVTRDARETQGTVLYGGGGNVHPAVAGIRHGDRIGENTYFRIFGGYHAKEEYRLPEGGGADDAWAAQHAGFRFDSHPDPDTRVTWLGDATFSQLEDGRSSGQDYSTLGRWTRELAAGGQVELQSYYNRTRRREITRSNNIVDTFDVSAEHDFEIGDRNRLIWGLGYRYMTNEIGQENPDIEVRNSEFDLHLFSGFVQNEFQLIPDTVSLTAGTKLEHNDFTGFEIQPSIRTAYKPTERQTLWAAVSRAVRTPSAVEGRDVFAFQNEDNAFVGPGGMVFVPTVVGDAGPGAEILHAYEIGYRIQPDERVSLDLASFYNDYRDLISFGRIDRFEGNAAIMPQENALSAETYGGEASLSVAPSDTWRLTGTYALLFARVTGPQEYQQEPLERSAPRHQVALHSNHQFGRRFQAGGSIRYVDTFRGVSSYTTADIRIAYSISDHMEASLVGRNLLHRHNREHSQEWLTHTAEIPRSFFAGMSWRY